MKNFIVFLGVPLALVASCSDPVTSGSINALPQENPNIPVGEFHRAGQPCVLCHSPSGPASSDDFSVAGTVFAQPQTAVGVDKVTVAFTDSLSSSFTTTTNCVGNFFVTKAQWDPSFPIFVRIFKNGVSRTMQGQIGRERSCANCHSDPPKDSPQIYSSVGHLSLYLAADNPPPPATDCPVSPVLQ